MNELRLETGNFLTSVTTTTAPVVNAVAATNGGATASLSSLACGDNAAANGDSAVAIGPASTASGFESTAVGTRSVAGSTGATAFGVDAKATGLDSTSIGIRSAASGDGATAVGRDSIASGTNSLALGSGAVSSGTNSVALGAGSTDGGLANVVSVGAPGAERKIINVSPGTISPTSTDAINGSQLYATNQAVANLDGRVSTLENKINSIGDNDEAFEGTAIALAMTGGTLPFDKNFAISANWGTFEGENAFAGSVFARVNDYWIVHGGLGVGLGEGTLGGTAGLTFAW